MNIFPKEIIENSAEVFKFKHTTNSKIIYSILLVVILGALISLPFIKVDVYTSSTGLVKPNKDRVPISLINSGRVKFSAIKDNKEVNVGDTVFIIENKIIDEQLKFSNSQSEEIQYFLKDLYYLVNSQTPNFNSIASAKYKASYLEYEQKLRELGTRYSQKKQNFDRSQKLFEKGVIAAAEFEPVKSEYDLSQSDIHSFKKQQNNRWQTELIKYQDELEELSSNKTQLIDNKSQFFITAPISGTLINTAQFGEGSFVSPGTLIAEISPNTDLIAECYVSPADIGLLKANQKVVFQIDAYNYNQWGFADGEILEISKDVELLENTPVFKVRCLINQDHLKLKNGVKGQIKKGMTLNARFLLTERSLFDLLYDNVDDWLNPSRV
ncbi:LOW QUALITY PROTEIN: HlyD family secretion protein [Gillisia sp. Hel_I_86]|nr:LOW QUALITY PROTEIN: HlyD family secretion protein [Gillisia sp. Hel_I_86]